MDSDHFAPSTPLRRNKIRAVQQVQALSSASQAKEKLENEQQTQQKAAANAEARLAEIDRLLADWQNAGQAALAEVKNQATTVTFITDTGETLEMSLADLTACENCILSFRTQGGLSTAFPGFDDLPRLRGVVQIVVS